MAAPEDNRALATGRRKLLIGSAPVIVTLAARPAFATVCTASAAASFNANHSSGNPISGFTCAVAPSCWTLRAQHEGVGAWLGTAYHPTDLFSTVFAGSGLAVVGNDTWRANPSTATLADALGGFIQIQYVKNAGNIFTMSNGPLFVAEATAALLNASFDATYNNGFSLTVAAVIQSVQSLWAYDPAPPASNDQAELEGQLTSRTNTYVAARGNGEPCDL
jgi:hypothetical protein